MDFLNDFWRTRLKSVSRKFIVSYANKSTPTSLETAYKPILSKKQIHNNVYQSSF